MYSVGIITFHASHNYGSMLQAYALRKIVKSLGFDCEIINFRTERQKKFYVPEYKKGTFYEKIKRFILQLPNISKINKKYLLFETFLRDELCISEEYSTLEDLNNVGGKFDYYISGSDQIWNTLILDFDWAYFLPFVKNGKKIAYAPSMGPTPEKVGILHGTKMGKLLRKYDKISVREPRTAKYLSKYIEKDISVVLDPTLLLSVSDWNKLVGESPLIQGDYCFCYSPWMNERTLVMASEWAKKNNVKVVVSKPFTYFSTIIHWRNVKVYPAVGPKEFLNLCKYARMVCCDSFHAVVFSLFFKTPFVALDGCNDSRISNLLSLCKLKYLSVSSGREKDVVKVPMVIDFEYALRVLEKEKVKSVNWLKDALA